MRAQQCTQESTILWTYGTNSTHCIEDVTEDGRFSPSGDKIIPDGLIYGPHRPLTLVTEIANSQTMSAAKKIEMAMRVPSVVGDILIDLQESPIYESPTWKRAEWRREDGDDYITAENYNTMDFPDNVRWGPRTIQGFQFAGSFTCFMEVIPRNKQPVHGVRIDLDYYPYWF